MNDSGALLLRHGLVTQAQLGAAMALKSKDGGSLGECLVCIGAVGEGQLVEFYHKRLMIPRMPDAKLNVIPARVLQLVPADMAAEFRVVPVEIDNEGTLTVAMADPSDNHAVDELAFFADRFVLRAVASESAVRRALETHYGLRFSSPRPGERAAPAPFTGPAAPPTFVGAPSNGPASDAKPSSGNAPPARSGSIQVPPKPSREELERQIVLLTRVKRSEETPLPMPVPPPPDYTPTYASDEPILLTKRKPPPEPVDTIPGMTLPIPETPLEQLRATEDRDEIVRLVLEYVAQMCRRALFFVVKKSLLVGHAGRGDDFELASLQKLAINIEVPSIFRDVIASRLPYRGPLPDTQANHDFAEAVGGVTPEVLVMPIAVRERIIAVLFADGAFLPMPDAALQATIREAGVSYERLIITTKGR